jgi:hypothetical protein
MLPIRPIQYASTLRWVVVVVVVLEPVPYILPSP